MTTSMIILIIIIIAALVLFSVEIVPAEVVSLGILTVLVLTNVLSPEEGFAGFSSDASIMILGLLILTTALVKTGLVQWVTQRILSHVKGNENRLYWLITAAAGGLSALMSNTATTAFFMPVTLEISKRLKINASRLLMPLAFATILSSSVTLISTSTNLVVSDLLAEHHLKPLGMFELTPVGIPILGIGLLYMFFVGRRMIPLRKNEMATGEVALQPYISEVSIPETSAWIGQTLTDLMLNTKYDLTVLRIKRPNTTVHPPRGDSIIQQGDKLLLEGHRDAILTLCDKKDVVFSGKFDGIDLKIPKDLRLAEVILMPNSRFIGRTLKGLDFRHRFGLQVLGINRKGKTLTRRIALTPLQAGDQLLIQGDPETVTSLGSDENFRILTAHVEAPVNTKKAPLAIGIFFSVMVLAGTNLLSLPVAVMLGVLAIFVTGCITPAQAYRSVHWNAWLLIACMLSLGKAMEVTGLAGLIANLINNWLGDSNPLLLLGAFFILSMLLTQPMSNQAAAVLIVPIAIQTALLLNYNPRTFAIMIAVGASCSFITPLEPACLMVFGPGNYRFTDFIKVGSLLTLIIFGIAMLLVPVIWPLTAI